MPPNRALRQLQAYFLAGDTSYTGRLLREGKVDGVSPNVAQARATAAMILQLAGEDPVIYLPSHDPDNLRRIADASVLTA